MAAKTGKGKGKGKGSHASRLNDAMKSINNNRTPISSLLPVQKQGSFSTGGKKGQRGSNPLSGPSKLLLTITDPGDTPTSPRVVADPASARNANHPTSAYVTNARPASWNARANSWDISHRNYASDQVNFNAAKSGFSVYRSQQTTYDNVTLPNYNTAKTEYQRGLTKNTSRTSQYKKDLNKFFSSKNKQVRVTSPGSRGSVSSKGSRR